MPAEFWSQIDTAGLAALDRGPRARVASAATLQRTLSSTVQALSVECRDAALGLALLWHDDLDGAHQLCQAHEGHADCDYVHALLHRREGDFANAKYWFREVGEHPVYPAVAAAALGLNLSALVDNGRWRPAKMVDACAEALGSATAQRGLLMQAQAAEFAALAAHILAR